MPQHGTVPPATFATPVITNSDASDISINHFTVCQRTGFKVPVDEPLIQEWNGLWVRPKSFEDRHPLDFIRGFSEKLNPSVRPEATDVFVSANEITNSDLPGG